jgi:UDP-N-acetylglucosamine 2-epimerase (hydrolysing)
MSRRRAGAVPRQRRILFVTGTRADFGKLKPLILGAQELPGLDVRVFATGMHMLARYGSTIIEIQRSGCRSVHPFVNQDGSVTSQMDLVLAQTVQGLGFYVREARPDLIVVHGDRVEALAGAIVGALNNVLVAHVEGGELSGTVDDLLRHAVSKLAHLHFVATDEARTRLIQMGECRETVFVIGSPDVDVMLSSDLPPLKDVRRHYDIPFEDYGILLYHPVTTERARLRRDADAVVEAVRRSGRNFVAVYPNNDHGSEVILARLRQLARMPRVRLLPSMRFEAFLTLLRHAQVILGNSSAGVREAPVYGVPTVNVGSRQHRRHQATSIIDTHADPEAILAALGRLPEGLAPSLHFGTGRSASLFVEALRSSALWRTPRQKQFRDAPADGTVPGTEAHATAAV